MQHASLAAAPAPPAGVNRPTTGIQKYTGPWGRDQAKHLLRRTIFGPKQAEIDLFASLTMEAAVEKILTPSVTTPPIALYDSANDQPGLTWVMYDNRGNQVHRVRSLKAWMINNMIHQEPSIGEKMLLFWHNHLVTSTQTVDRARFSYFYVDLLRKHALGNFKTLAREISTDPAMLIYLSGNTNTQSAPNENYARELMELFTLGATDVNGNPNYTEEDVVTAARVLTGWNTKGYNQGVQSITNGHVFFLANQHDPNPKQFSSHFGNQVIHRPLATEYELELDDLIDMIFSRSEVSLFICRELYRWFLYYDIDNHTEQNVIQPMASTLVANNYDIRPVLKLLLESQHFNDALMIGTMIKNPADYVIGALRQLEIKFPVQIVAAHKLYHFAIGEKMVDMDMDVLDPPNVAGWSAYYQSPGFHERWVTGATHYVRTNFLSDLIRNKIRYSGNQATFQVGPFVVQLTKGQAHDVNQVVDATIDLLFPVPITANQRTNLKEILTGGLPDFEWTAEWALYLPTAANGNHANTKTMHAKLFEFFTTALSMAEYHLT